MEFADEADVLRTTYPSRKYWEERSTTSALPHVLQSMKVNGWVGQRKGPPLTNPWRHPVSAHFRTGISLGQVLYNALTQGIASAHWLRSSSLQDLQALVFQRFSSGVIFNKDTVILMIIPCSKVYIMPQLVASAYATDHSGPGKCSTLL